MLIYDFIYIYIYTCTLYNCYGTYLLSSKINCSQKVNPLLREYDEFFQIMISQESKSFASKTIYVFSAKTLTANGGLATPSIGAIQTEHSIDIDVQDDLQRAEMFLHQQTS